MRLPCHLSTALFAAVLTSTTLCVRADDVERTGGPYVPTPQAVVDAMLDFAEVGPRDFVIDLGSGDGRIVLTAAERYQARGVGIEIDPELVETSNAEAKKRGLDGRASFLQGDVLKAAIDEATVVTLYLLPGMMRQLEAKFSRELAPGTRIVAHDFSFGEWKPDRERSVDVPEKYGSAGQWKSTLFYWVVPVRIEGAWQVSAPDLNATALALDLGQKFQFVQGAAVDRGRKSQVADGRLAGNRIRFRLPLAGGSAEFRGMVEGPRMHGVAERGGRTVPWTAVRAP